ncbi:MAG TPA: tetratricopeptide repeat protein [Longimicrobium sp.]|nr:tetratricopeptide repeat protein [Longimicrobium sp.]
MSDPIAARRERGLLLARQGRAEMAEREYRLALAEAPYDADTHALLALLLAEQEPRRAEALLEARTAVHHAPDQMFPHYVEARVHLEAERWEQAQRAAERAIRIAPDSSRPWVVVAAAHLHRGRWQDGLNAAETALALDPTHMTAANLRARALVQLGRRDEASAALQGALAQDPENSSAHFGQGWAQLHRGDPRAALGHFREALRLDPESEAARLGLAEALKARNPLYAGMLRYFLWMQRLEPRTRWMVILGGFIAYRIADAAVVVNPALGPWLVPLMIAFAVFVLLSWTAPQVFNAVLLASRDGRYVLSPEQRTSGAWMAAGMAAAAVATGVTLASDNEWLSTGAMMFAALLIPLAVTFRGPRGRPTRGMAMVTAGLYALTTASMVLDARGTHDVAGGLFAVVVLGVVATAWGVLRTE